MSQISMNYVGKKVIGKIKSRVNNERVKEIDELTSEN